MKNKIMEGLDDMDQRFIDEAVNTPEQLRAKKYWVRWIAAAACLALMLSLGLLWYQRSREKIVLPPVRTGASEATATLVREYSLKEAFAEADLVAWVRVGNWIGDNGHTTRYQAQILECYKGNGPDSIILFQSGSVDATFKNYPLHTYGNEVLVFLSASSDTPNGYFSIASFATDFDVVTDTDGKCYIRDKGFMTQMLDRDGIIIQDAQKREEVLYNCMIAADPYMETVLQSFGKAYALEDIVALFS